MNVIADRIVRKNPFLRDWSNYGIVDIFNPVAIAQYQHSVTIPTKPGMMHDFRDLRFFQPDGSEIPFWIESKTDGSTAFVWLKPYSASNRQAYVFYGNRDAVSQSNGDKTFEFFDDFLGSSLNAAKWTNIKGEGVTVSGGVVSCAADSSDAHGIVSVNNMGADIAVRFSASAGHPTSTSYVESLFARYIDDNNFVSAYPAHIVTSYAGKYLNLSSANLSSSAITGLTTGYHVMEAALGVSSVTWTYDDSNPVTLSTNYVTSSGKVRITAYGAGSIMYGNWVLVRKYTATEPVCQLNQSGLRNPAYR